MLGVQVHLAQRLVAGKVQGERIAGSRIAAVRAGIETRRTPLLGVGAAVERQVTEGRHRHRRAPQPEVDQIEVVRRQVHQQPAAVAFVAVPAPEVVGAVPGIEQPLEVHGRDLPHRPLGDDSAHRGGERRIAVVVGDPHRTSGPFDGVDDRLQPVLVDRQRFFADDVAAPVQRTDDIAIMGSIDRADDQGVRTLLGEHRLEPVGCVQGRLAGAGIAPHHAVGVLHASAVEVTERHHLCPVAEVAGQRLIEETAASARSNERIAPSGTAACAPRPSPRGPFLAHPHRSGYGVCRIAARAAIRQIPQPCQCRIWPAAEKLPRGAMRRRPLRYDRRHSTG